MMGAKAENTRKAYTHIIIKRRRRRLYTGAPSGSVLQNILSFDNFLLAFLWNRAEFCPMTTPKLTYFPVSQVAGCRCNLLAGNSFISLAGSEEQINLFQHAKMLKMASESFIHALLLLGLFLKISLCVPLR